MPHKITSLSTTLILTLLLLLSERAVAQNTLNLHVSDKQTGEALVGVNVILKDSTLGASTDRNGDVSIKKIPDGRHTFVFSYIGYEKQQLTLTFPLTNPGKVIRVELDPENLTYQTITVTSARTHSHINQTPVRVEVLSSEDLNEKTFENPFNISEILSELSAVQTVQTSPTTGAMSFRLLGLYGRYTQLLRNGFPLYGGLKQDLSFLQIPPIDLKRVEIIKGPSSVLYGNGAISGIINLIPKKPDKGTHMNLLLNHTSLKGTGINMFGTYRKGVLGMSVTASRDLQRPVDVNHNGFTDLPGVQSFHIDPKGYLYFNKHTTLSIGLHSDYERRIGGDIAAVRHYPEYSDRYRETDRTQTNYYTARFEDDLPGNDKLTIKNTLGSTHLIRLVPDEPFSGRQTNSYTEITWEMAQGEHQMVFGSDFVTDVFHEDSSYSGLQRNYDYSTIGFFAQDLWSLSQPFSVQAGFRADYHNRYHWFVLPQVSLLYSFSKSLYLRATEGLGYQVPTLFSSPDNQAFDEVTIPGPNVLPERSDGSMLDLHYRHILDEWVFSLDQAFFLTHVRHPLSLNYDSQANRYRYFSEPSPLKSAGFESNIRISMDEWQWFLGYSFTRTHRDFAGGTPIPLTPENKIVTILSYEEEGDWSVDAGAIVTGEQHLDNGEKSPAFVTCDMLLKKEWGHLTLIGNVENIFNYRQSSHHILVSGPPSSPEFNQIWGPIEGRLINIAAKISF